MNDAIRARFLGSAEKLGAIATDTDDDIHRGYIDQALQLTATTLDQLQAATSPWSAATATNLAFILSSAAVVLAWLRSSPGTGSAWTLAVVAVLCFDLLWFGRTFGAHAADDRNPHAPPEYFAMLDPSRRVFSLVNPDDARSGSWNEFRAALPSHLTAAWELDTPDGNTGLAPQMFLYQLVHPFTDPLVPGRVRLRRAVASQNVFRLLGIGTVISGKEWGSAPWPLLYEGEGIRVWRIPDSLPRAFTSTRRQLAEIGRTSPRAEPMMRIGDEALANVLLVAQPVVPVGATQSPDEVEYEVNASEPTVLIRTTRVFPGWRAYVDGAPATIETVLGFFQGVRVPVGRHRVRLEFRPEALLHGSLLSAVGCVLLLLLLVGAARKRASRPSVGTAS